jgi:hypothetical protein
VRRIALSLCVVAAAAIAAPAALGGGFATTGLSSTPDGLRAGEPWKVEITVLQHGRTPAAGLRPRVRLNGPGGARREVAARPTARVGVYAASVRFPAAGRWTYTVFDGFNDEMPTTYAPVTIAPRAGAPAPTPSTPADDGGLGVWPVVLGGAALAIVGGALALGRRRRTGALPA